MSLKIKQKQNSTKQSLLILKCNLRSYFGFVFSTEVNTRSPIYESINFDASLVAHSNVVLSSKTNKLQRQNAFDDTHPTSNVQKPEKQQTDRNIIDFLNRCIPPPPDSTPPRSTDSDIYVDPIQISSRTLERLNSLYGMYKMKDSIGNNDEDEVVYRFREFQNFTPRSFRGSSKAMCSFASVLTFNHNFF